jgi:hypothetical protein
MGLFSKVSELLGSNTKPSDDPAADAGIRLQLHDSWLETVKEHLLELAGRAPAEEMVEDISSLFGQLDPMRMAPVDEDWRTWRRPIRTYSRAEALAEERAKEAELRKSVVVVGDDNDPGSSERFGIPLGGEIDPDNVWEVVQTVAISLRAMGHPKTIDQLSAMLGTVSWQLQRAAEGEPIRSSPRRTGIE